MENENMAVKSINEEQSKIIVGLRAQIDKMSESQKYVSLSKILEDMHLDHSDLELQLKKLSEMDTQNEVYVRRITDLEVHIDKLNKSHQEELFRL